ncbi:MAG: ThuA domain-containing protein [Verrucomicrobiota bacterium]
MRSKLLFLLSAAVAAMILLPASVVAQQKPLKVLFFSKSSGYEHSVIARKDGKPSFAENLLAEVGPKQGVEFTFSKDGSLFTPEYIAGFDVLVFYTTGDLTTAGTDKNPPMTPEGKKALLSAINKGKGFVGVHCATDTFHTPETGTNHSEYHNDGNAADPYIQMIGGEFIIHDKQQKAKSHVADPSFPGMPKEDFELFEEWYSLKNIGDDLHVLLVQETQDMQGKPYHRPPYPSTWARLQGKGRVFETSMGHREDVWTNPLFQDLLFGGIKWAAGQGSPDVKPTVQTVTPGYRELPPK